MITSQALDLRLAAPCQGGAVELRAPLRIQPPDLGLALGAGLAHAVHGLLQEARGPAHHRDVAPEVEEHLIGILFSKMHI